jgi:membrane protein CcdC involved in cytochrome C biogenesis
MKELLKDYLDKVDIMKSIVGLTILIVFSVLVMKVIHEEIPDNNREIVIHILGIVEGALMALVTFYYGSSKGSQKKDQLLAESLPKETPK